IEFSPTAQSDVFTYDKAIGGNANVAKSGAGKAILTQANAYTGTTTVTAGVLEIQGAQAGNGAFDVTGGTLLVKGSIGTGAVTVSGTGILGGTGTINGAITIEEGGTLSPGASVETLSITGDVTFKAGSTLLIELQYVGDQWTYDVLNVSSGVTLTFEEGAQLQIVNLGTEPLTKGVEINFFGSELPNFVGNPFGSVSFEGFGDEDFRFTIGPDGKFAVVPEPGTYALFGGIGAVALALLRRRRKSRTGL
ncbi:MAG: autotransporter-associated beta strand repeat-containing protein, partial [Puniceicoccales bacterium]|nr:autotransporter-associated beta strand repeat-containing protein [Puniceicoccales bacterium]